MNPRTLLVAALAAGLVACGGGGSSGGGNQPPPPPPGSGLSQRPSNTSCIAPSSVVGNASLATPPAFPNLTFTDPVHLLQAPGDNTRWFLLEKPGIVRSFLNNQATAATTVVLDIRGRVLQLGQSEAGLLGMAFHPNFANNGRVFINYTDRMTRSITSEFTTPDGGLTLDPNSERVLLTVNKPFDNHNGGNLAFGPDGFLYLGLGDGGGGGDPGENAQNPQRLLGKMLRIDVDNVPAGQPYGIPPSNPFAGNARCNQTGVGTQNCPEIFATGLRNPWRWSFDTATGVLWVADVGQGQWEEIDHVALGGNYGWDVREGAHCFEPPSNCSTMGLIDPVAEYSHALGGAITGGFVYRGTQNTSLFGRYIFADFESGMFASLTPGAGGTFTINQLVPPFGTPAQAPGQLNPASFGQANDGELFAVDFVRGRIFHLLFTGGGGGGDNVPQQLSATGCINTTAAGAPPLLTLIPYTLNAPFWSDGAVKERWLGLPNGQNIGVAGSGDWNLPEGTVIVKHFRVANRLIETRLFMNHPPDGDWAGYTFQWNQAQTEATRISGGATVAIGGGQNWIFPSEAQCMQCHTEAAGFSLGLETAQQNRTHLYPQTGLTANQITTLNAINALTPPVGANPPAYADPADTARTLTERARSYLHTNCANCHRPQGPTPVDIDLRHDTPLSQTEACDMAPSAGDLGIANARIIAPGDDARSVLLARMATRNVNAMPPIASNVRDSAGEALISAWIDSLTPASCQ